MKKFFLLTVIFIVALSSAICADYEYYGTVTLTTPDISLGGVALKADGDLYYVHFGGATSDFVYVDNAVPGCLTSAFTLTTISTEVLPAGRGLNDIDLDSAGNIYISGTGNDAATSVLKKFTAAPAHALAWSSADVRHNGIEVMTDDILVIGDVWNKIGFKKTSDGTAEGTASIAGGDSYGRSVTFNSSNNDIYVGRNGNSTLDALKIFSGGSPTSLASYALALDHQLPTLGNSTATASATQPNDYDWNNNELLAADAFDQASPANDTNQGLRVYTIAGSGATTVFTEIQFFNGSTIAGRPGQYNNVYGVSYNRIEGKDYVAIAGSYGDPATNVIDILVRPGSAVADWNLY